MLMLLLLLTLLSDGSSSQQKWAFRPNIIVFIVEDVRLGS